MKKETLHKTHLLVGSVMILVVWFVGAWHTIKFIVSQAPAGVTSIVLLLAASVYIVWVAELARVGGEDNE